MLDSTPMDQRDGSTRQERHAPVTAPTPHLRNHPNRSTLLDQSGLQTSIHPTGEPVRATSTQFGWSVLRLLWHQDVVFISSTGIPRSSPVLVRPLVNEPTLPTYQPSHCPFCGNRGSTISAIRSASVHESTGRGSKLKAGDTATTSDTKPPSIICTQSVRSLSTES